ncbi:TerB family tellurite resistance protein [Flavobacterium beibuense]|uniref:TerB family tellurite resistance protein n=1 Tax=Flavobacterium beibuense TaxID=657326 RepID=A0A444WEN2_9FLAO|nr:TerB family tellurite resistance protein [Flavobacterium beibuense]RYJ44308.1 hypothetical protein NU09_0918 [Flavobacterium beibuense]
MLIWLLPAKTTAQMQELQQLALNIEKLVQFRSILKDMKKGYEILNGGYNTVKELSEGNFKLHETFLDALLQVSPTVRNYKRVADIIDYQILLVQEYQAARNAFGISGAFNPDELSYLTTVYDNLFKQSLRNLDELTGILTAGSMRMSDNERLEAIDRIYDDMQEKLLFLRDFNGDAKILALQRAKEEHDVKALRILNGINN